MARAQKYSDPLPSGRVFLTGDTHGVFARIARFCQKRKTNTQDTLILLGDAGINYYGGERELELKRSVSALPITLFCIHGNHERRPSADTGYELREYHGGQVWVQPEFPNLLFAVDGEIYDFLGHECLAIGGAYSVDKWMRIFSKLEWWPDEQPSEEIKDKVERVLEDRGWQVDVVLSHTCPKHYIPEDAFLPGFDWESMDESTEIWLDAIEQRLDYTRWYCGHYHVERSVDKLRFMYEDYDFLPQTLELAKEA